jgi:ATP-dependent DNA helicase RecG
VARNEALKLIKKDASMSLPEHAALKGVFLELSKKKNIWNYIKIL